MLAAALASTAGCTPACRAHIAGSQPRCCPPLPLLAGLGDIANTRALFERALNATAPEAAAELWDAYLAFEYDVGTLQVGGWGHKVNCGGDVCF